MHSLLLSLLLAATVHGCSNFAMENAFMLSARTEDTGDQPFPFAIVTKPKGSVCVRSAAYGYVAFTLDVPGKALNDTGIKGGLNTAGLNTAGLNRWWAEICKPTGAGATATCGSKRGMCS